MVSEAKNTVSVAVKIDIAVSQIEIAVTLLGHRRKVMEMKNFTGGETLQTYAELYCAVEITGEVHE